MAHFPSKDIQVLVNIVLEETPTKLNQQTVRMVGFVILNNSSIKLSDLRLKILSDFDDQQLQIIGLNFKFLKKTFPVSSKQETSLTLRRISVHLSNTNSPSNVGVSFVLHSQPKCPTQEQNTDKRRILFHKDAQRSNSAPQTNDHSLIIAADTDEKLSVLASPINGGMANQNISMAYEALPHHYQYMSSHNLTMGSPMLHAQPNPITAMPVESAFPKVTMVTNTNSNTSNTPNENVPLFGQQINEREYTIMVRACHSVLRRSNSDETVIVHSLLDTNLKNSSHNSSMSVFSNFNIKESAINLRREWPAKKRKINPKKQTENNESFIASFISTYPISPKSTRLETELGEKLPRIRPQTSQTKNDNELPSTEVDTILKQAFLLRKNTENLGINGSIPLISVGEEKIQINEQSVSISVDEETQLKPIEKNLDPPNCSIVPLKMDRSDDFFNGKALSTPPHTFQTFKPSNKYEKNTNGFTYIDDKIQCKFTVIGSPMINGAENKDHKLDNIVWEFSNVTDLLKGLSGVHHSHTNPVWIDTVCDRHTFINIAEHIRPAIHKLTIEDCLTDDCREKLEIFKEYLFLCIRASNRKNDQNTTHSINILIFKTMIITYHLGHVITTNVVQQTREILNKKFGNSVCASPSWICHTIIDNVIDKMMPEIESTVREVETCERLVFKLCADSQTELLRRMQIARQWMVLYRSRLWPKSTITHNLLNNYLWRKDFLNDVPQPYWRDINDHVARMVDLLELGTQTLESIQSVFVAKVSLEMTQQSNNLAVVGGKLAGVGAVFLPLTVLTGMWGMNCKVPFQYNPEGNDDMFGNTMYGFIIVVFIMFVVSIVTWKFVNRKGWVH